MRVDRHDHYGECRNRLKTLPLRCRSVALLKGSGWKRGIHTGCPAASISFEELSLSFFMQIVSPLDKRLHLSVRMDLPLGESPSKGKS